MYTCSPTSPPVSLQSIASYKIVDSLGIEGAEQSSSGESAWCVAFVEASMIRV